MIKIIGTKGRESNGKTGIFIYRAVLAVCGDGAQPVRRRSGLQRDFDCADRILQRSVRDICFQGPEEALNRTENTQPCILTTEYAAYAALSEYGIRPDAMAGFSLGNTARWRLPAYFL